MKHAFLPQTEHTVPQQQKEEAYCSQKITVGGNQDHVQQELCA